MATKLIATYPILYESKQYKVGEQLPANNHDMTKTWLDAGTAKWEELNENISDINQSEVNDEKDIDIDNNQVEQKEILNEIDQIKVQALGDIEVKDTEEENNNSKLDEKNSKNDNVQDTKTKKK